jgi:hypothetical protein
MYARILARAELSPTCEPTVQQAADSRGRTRDALTFAPLFEGDIREAQEILGHSAACTLQVYRKRVSGRQEMAVAELDSRLKVVPIREGGCLTVSSTTVHTVQTISNNP